MKRTEMALVIGLLFVMQSPVFGQSIKQKSIGGPEDLVSSLYSLISFEAGKTPDWTRVRPLFHDHASIYLRTSQEDMTLYNPDGFVARFQADIYALELAPSGFTETIRGLTCDTYSEIAQCRVVYEAKRLSGKMPPQRGVDFFQLVQQDGLWLIFSIVNDVEMFSGRIPEAWVNR